MSVTKQSIMDTRRHQMFPTLEPAEIERVRRFGKVRSYGVGEALARVGEVGLGLTIILAGKVDITSNRVAASQSSLTARAHSWANWRNWQADRPCGIWRNLFGGSRKNSEENSKE